MRVAIVGSRNYLDMDHVRVYVRRALDDHDVVVSGRARGVDNVAVECAQQRGLQVEVIPANWELHGKRAGPIRNAELVATKPDRLVTFWDGRSPGTKDVARKARAAGIPVIDKGHKTN